jgi:hypothetical protein
MSDGLCEIVQGVECDHDDGVDLGEGDLEAIGDVVAVEYARADGTVYRHEFNPETDALTYAAPGVLVIVGQFDVDGLGIWPDHDPEDI